VCWTEAPATLSVLRRQRARWHRGLVRTLWDNRGVLFNPRYGTLGMLSFPHAFLFEMLGPFVEILGYIVVASAFLLGLLNAEFFLLFLAASVLYGIFLSVAAVLLEEMSFRRYPGWIDLCKLLVFSVVENLGYRQLLSLFKIKALWDVLLGRRGWGRMERAGFQQAPDGATVSAAR